MVFLSKNENAEKFYDIKLNYFICTKRNEVFWIDSQWKNDPNYYKILIKGAINKN